MTDNATKATAQKGYCPESPNGTPLSASPIGTAPSQLPTPIPILNPGYPILSTLLPVAGCKLPVEPLGLAIPKKGVSPCRAYRNPWPSMCLWLPQKVLSSLVRGDPLGSQLHTALHRALPWTYRCHTRLSHLTTAFTKSKPPYGQPCGCSAPPPRYMCA